VPLVAGAIAMKSFDLPIDLATSAPVPEITSQKWTAEWLKVCLRETMS